MSGKKILIIVIQTILLRRKILINHQNQIHHLLHIQHIQSNLL